MEDPDQLKYVLENPNELTWDIRGSSWEVLGDRPINSYYLGYSIYAKMSVFLITILGLYTFMKLISRDKPLYRTTIDSIITQAEGNLKKFTQKNDTVTNRDDDEKLDYSAASAEITESDDIRSRTRRNTEQIQRHSRAAAQRKEHWQHVNNEENFIEVEMVSNVY